VEWEGLSDKGKQQSLTEAQTRKVCSEILELATGAPLHFATVNDFFADWLKDKTGASAKKTNLKVSADEQEFSRCPRNSREQGIRSHYAS